MDKLGIWGKEENGLPCFSYTAALPYQGMDKSGQRVKLPEDP